MSKGLVIDASIAGPWILADESHPISDKALDVLAAQQGHVPQLWFYEIGNLITTCLKRRRLAVNETQEAMSMLDQLALRVAPPGDQAEILALTIEHSLSFYDAAYLETALRDGHELATLDRQLADAARRQGVPVLS